MAKHKRFWTEVLVSVLASSKAGSVSERKGRKRAVKEGRKRRSDCTKEVLQAELAEFLRSKRAKKLLFTEADHISLREEARPQTPPQSPTAGAKRFPDIERPQAPAAKKRKYGIEPSQEAGPRAVVRRRYTPQDCRTLHDIALTYAQETEGDTSDLTWLLAGVRKGRSGVPHADFWQRLAEAVPGRSRQGLRRFAARELSEGRKKWMQDSDTEARLAPSWRADARRMDVKAGRFSKRERETLMASVCAYADAHGLSTSDFGWLIDNDLQGRRTRAWVEIASALPNRTLQAIWHRCITMLHPRYKQGGKWTAEEDERLMDLIQHHGTRWKLISKELDRTPQACNRRWRELRTMQTGRRTGRWNEDECASLRKAVEEYMQLQQAGEEQTRSEARDATLSAGDVPEKASHTTAGGRINMRHLIDDVNWTFVSERVRTRSAIQCLDKWYYALAPSMVATGEWGNGDDRRLLRALLQAGARLEFDVDWGTLVPGRSERQARRRWRLMLRAVPDAAETDFAGHLSYLAQTYTPALWDEYGF